MNRNQEIKTKVIEYGIISFQVACFILGATFVISIVSIFARLAYLLLFAEACKL